MTTVLWISTEFLAWTAASEIAQTYGVIGCTSKQVLSPSSHPLTPCLDTRGQTSGHNLKEVVNIWSGGSDQASINFVVQDGVASLQLGRPDDPHILPQDQDSDHVQTEPQSQEHAGWQQQ